MDGPGSRVLIQILLIILFTYIKAFFAKTEISFVSVSESKLKSLVEDGDYRAQMLLDMIKDQTRLLFTIEIGLIFAGFFTMGIGTFAFFPMFDRLLIELGIPYSQVIAFVVITILLASFSLLFGEWIPKRVALQNDLRTALRSARLMRLFYHLFAPVVILLSYMTKLVLLIFGKYSEDVEEKISAEEIKSYLKVGQQQGVINPSGEEMMVNIMDFDDKLAYKIMTPRTSIYMIDYDEFNIDMIKEMLATGFSRAPVYKDNPDNIVGTIYIKDLFVAFSREDYQSINIDDVIKEPYFIPETKNIDLLLKELQDSKNYLAILIDEYGGFSGMVTIEDIVEEIVGEIEDEYDPDEIPILKVDDRTYIVDGTADLEDINRELEIDLQSENHETISGLLIELLGFIPEEKDPEKHHVIYDDHIRLTELGVTDKRIEKVEIYLMDELEIEE